MILCTKGSRDIVESMIGDLNFFFFDEFRVAEINMMIAEKMYRRRNFASEAIKFSIDYLKKRFPQLEYLEAKIQSNNEASIALFQKLKFYFHKDQPVFDEVIYRLTL